MEAAVQAFMITIAIVGGILSPLVLFALIGTVNNILKAVAVKLDAKVEEIKKLPPFDDVELNLNPATQILTGRIIKDGKVLRKGSIRRQEDDIK